MTSGRRAFLLGTVALIAGCRGVANASPPSDAEIEALVATFQAHRPTGQHPVSLSRMVLGEDELWVWRPASGPAPLVGTIPVPPAYLERLESRFGPAPAHALVRATGRAGLDAPLLEGLFPVVLFQPGASFGARDYRVLLEDLASHGVIVLAFHPFASPKGSEGRYAEVDGEFRRVLDALPRAVETRALTGASLDDLVLVGHSIGGAGAVLALDHPLAACAVNIDGDYAGAAAVRAPDKPILYLIGENPRESEASRARRARVWTEVGGGLKDATALRVHGMAHLDITDAGVLPLPDPGSSSGVHDGSSAHAAVRTTLLRWLGERGVGGASTSPSSSLVSPAFVAADTP